MCGCDDSKSFKAWESSEPLLNRNLIKCGVCTVWEKWKTNCDPAGDSNSYLWGKRSMISRVTKSADEHL